MTGLPARRAITAHTAQPATATAPATENTLKKLASACATAASKIISTYAFCSSRSSSSTTTAPASHRSIRLNTLSSSPWRRSRFPFSNII